MDSLRSVTLVIAWLLVAPVRGATQSPDAPPADPTAAAVGSAPAPAADPQGAPGERSLDGTDAYTVSPGDQLQIVVRKEPELTRDVLVRPDGRITVPLLGDVDAAGKTPGDLADEIARGLARFVNTPRVTVGVGQAVSARVFVIGQVNRAGEVSLATPLTVVQALALAGGFKEFAKRESILVVGRDRKVRTFNFKKFESGQDLDSNVVLRPGDTVVVP